MPDLAYALVTPYSLSKSRTGGILGRILSRTGLELVGARLYAPSDALVEEYAATFERSSLDRPIRQALGRYIREHLSRKNRSGISNRCLLFLFEGENAERRLREDALGPFGPSPPGDTVRGTFGEYLGFSTGDLPYFEPAVLGSPEEASLRDQLRLFADRAASDGGVLETLLPAPAGKGFETTLVMIKPDNFQRPSVRPGNILDMFSQTGLALAAARVVRLSLEQADAFYGPLKAVFLEKMRDPFLAKVRPAIEGALPYPVPGETLDGLWEDLRERHALHEFYRIVQYMTGLDPRALPRERWCEPGPERVLALLYRGERAISKVRERLGSTDPRKAAPGTVRSDFGRDVMANAAHASDSPENALRERRIVGLVGDEAQSEEAALIRKFLG